MWPARAFTSSARTSAPPLCTPHLEPPIRRHRIQGVRHIHQSVRSRTSHETSRFWITAASAVGRPPSGSSPRTAPPIWCCWRPIPGSRTRIYGGSCGTAPSTSECRRLWWPTVGLRSRSSGTSGSSFSHPADTCRNLFVRLRPVYRRMERRFSRSVTPSSKYCGVGPDAGRHPVPASSEPPSQAMWCNAPSATTISGCSSTVGRIPVSWNSSVATSGMRVDPPTRNSPAT
jgi:hypothetical protein